MLSVIFPLFAKTLPWRDIFASHNIFANATKQRFLAMMNCSEPFLFLFDFYCQVDVFISLVLARSYDFSDSCRLSEIYIYSFFFLQL